MALQTYKIGIIFKLLDAIGSVSGSHRKAPWPPTSVLPLRLADSTHWILVFTANGRSHTIELGNDDGRITFKVNDYNYKLVAYYFGTYTGTLVDIFHIGQNHPMNGRTYHLGHDIESYDDDDEIFPVIFGVIKAGRGGLVNKINNGKFEYAKTGLALGAALALILKDALFG
ncbi:hypothetical protein FRC17_010284 [Serendipita sp. 399]|nr:hypothetical protein FRC17_010284 [Serendipita sp. 399]